MKGKLVPFCAGGALLLAGVAHSGIFFPRTLWATLGAAVFGVWLGFAVYRLTEDPFE